MENINIKADKNLSINKNTILITKRITAIYILLATSSFINLNGKCPYLGDGDNKNYKKNQSNCYTYKNIFGADYCHPYKKCWINYPHLKTKWEAINPEKAITRNTRISTKERTDFIIHLTIINKPTPVVA